jgi:hypothetical protein
VENFVQPLRLLDADHIKEALVREGGGEQLAGGQGHRLCTDVRTWADTQWIEDLTTPLALVLLRKLFVRQALNL